MSFTALKGHPLELALGELGFFDHHNRLMIWRGITPGKGLDDLIALQTRLVRELTSRDVAVEARPYRPHITLARNARLVDEAPVEVVPVFFAATAIRLMDAIYDTLNEGCLEQLSHVRVGDMEAHLFGSSTGENDERTRR